jgi:hypothetical protein
LRVYDADRGGAPLYSVDLFEHLDVPFKPPKKKNNHECKNVKDATRKRFRGVWLALAGRMECPARVVTASRTFRTRS